MPTILSKEKSFRFELIRGATIEEHFNLIYPPESYRIVEKSRHNIMKVFSNSPLKDNVFIDDFGDDNKVINIRGTTGSPEARRGYQDFFTGGFNIAGTIAWSGQEAMKNFRDIIINWRTKKLLQGKNIAEYTVKFIDFFNEEEYNVFITNFEMNRTASRPLFYEYSIDMIAISPNLAKPKINPLKFIETAKNTVVGINQLYEEGIALLSDNIVTQALDDLVSLSIETFELINSTTNIINEVGAITVDVIDSVANDVNTIRDNLGLIIDKLENVWYNDYLLLFSDFAYVTKKLERSFARLVTFKKQYNYKNEEDTIIENIDFDGYFDRGYDSNENKQSVRLDEAEGKTLSELVKLSREKYGIDITEFRIADYNKMSNSIVDPGQIIRIPIDSGQNYNENNQVITDDKLGDVFGVDLKFSDSGTLEGSSSGDISVVSNTDNLKQAITTALNTELNALVKLPNYGFDIKNSIGIPDVSLFVKAIKIKYISTIKADPRISNVYDVVVTIDGNKITISSIIVASGSKIVYKFSL